jgi:hypothetical protein
MVRHVAVAVLVAGCYHPASETACSITCGPDGSCPNGLSCIGGLCRGSSDTCGSSDGGVDARPDAPVPSDACPTYGLGIFQTVLCPGMTTLNMPPQFNTDTDCNAPNTTQVLVGGMPVCVVYAHTLNAGSLRATGTAPLVLAADFLQINGSLDVSGHFPANGPSGAGSGFACGGGAPGTQGGGGAGGSASGVGGDGGASDNGQHMLGLPARVLTQLVGGCPGAPGYNFDPGSNHGGGGPGGGVVYLIGRTELSLAASTAITAAGAGGQGGVSGSFGGGGGGGAGGLIGLDSSGLVVGAQVQLCANGGGGGGGGSGPGDATPQVGSDAGDGCLTLPAGGGQNGGSGGNGGDGNGSGGTTIQRAGRPGVNESVNTDSAGGGGGGGAAGYIYVVGNILPATLDTQATVRPPAQ